ncbi:MAG TPA: membrane dipeptidase [Myxococcales bacterium]|nr:membrane dipeptidase [Myxococcales bacterium]
MMRRTFLAAAALLPGVARGAEEWAPYSRTLLIDALGGPGIPGTPEEAQLSPQAVRDAVASGLTACNVTVGYTESLEACVEGIGRWQREIDLHPDAFLRVRSAADLETAKATRRLGLIFGTQNLAMIGGEPSRLGTLRDLGVRIVQLTYNLRNLLGDGSIEPADAGLSRLGRTVIGKVNELRLLLDLSHGGYRTITEAIAASSRPCAISHTGCAAITAHPRNVPDAVLRALAEKGGVAGIYFMPYLREKGQQTAQDVVRHLEHALEVAGEDHVGLGTDGNISPLVLTPGMRRAHREEVEKRRKAGIAAPNEDPDVFLFAPDLNTPRRFETLALLLRRRGHQDARIAKILGENFARLFREVWGTG